MLGEKENAGHIEIDRMSLLPPVVDDARADLALRELAAAWQFQLTGEQCSALLTYGRLLLQWNSHINLTGAGSLPVLIAEHFPDSFVLASRLRDNRDITTLVDVGSGGGLPALPLALLLERLQVHLVEPIAKKTAFLRTAVRSLGLPDRVRVAGVRLDAFAQEHPEPFDAAVSRATFHPQDWLSAALPLVRPGGTVFALSTSADLESPAGWLPASAIPYASRRRWVHEFKRST
ncbi:MAG TPA: 16S rRNA (guanine(527)-N(7))-methyltransferase RsmG [Polyangia bacterium]|jgi:16S rRNA (guanine527-N7)-methyltransferase|nr:16S rRNA (guanine(527)-N(7))-methyltransferase RsmG [Polyangia bacterium]